MNFNLDFSNLAAHPSALGWYLRPLTITSEMVAKSMVAYWTAQKPLTLCSIVSFLENWLMPMSLSWSSDCWYVYTVIRQQELDGKVNCLLNFKSEMGSAKGQLFPLCSSVFSQLSKSGSGCQIADFYAGCFGYADDLFLLCPSRKGLQEMLDISRAGSSHVGAPGTEWWRGP